MKRTLLFIITLIFIALQASAQKSDEIPNPSYEAWNDTIEAPISWGTPNPYTMLAGLQCVTRDSDDPYDGLLSAKLTSIFVLTFKVPGTVTLGWLTVNLITTEASVDGGIPWTSKPAKLKGQYKYAPALEEPDSCAVFVIFTQFLPVKGKRDTIGAGVFYGAEAVSEWTEFDIDINFFGDKTPDTMNIIIVSSASLFNPVPGSTMWVDAVEFEGEQGIAMDIIPAVKVNVYPNPATELINFDFEKKIDQSDLIIYNTEGQIVSSQKINQQKTTLDIGNLSSGTYYFHVLDGKKRISSGSFVVN